MRPDGEPYRPVPVETVLDTPEIVLLDGDGNAAKRPRGWPTSWGRAPRRHSTSRQPAPRRLRLREGLPPLRRRPARRRLRARRHRSRRPGQIALQYWFFWYFDDYVNTHEGDWEFMQIVFPGSTAEEALAAPPLEVGYSQHSGGERADWAAPSSSGTATTPWSTRRPARTPTSSPPTSTWAATPTRASGATTPPALHPPPHRGATAALAAESHRRVRVAPVPGALGRVPAQPPTTRRRVRSPRRSGAGRSPGRTPCATRASPSRPASRVGPTATGAFCSLVKSAGRSTPRSPRRWCCS